MNDYRVENHRTLREPQARSLVPPVPPALNDLVRLYNAANNCRNLYIAHPNYHVGRSAPRGLPVIVLAAPCHAVVYLRYAIQRVETTVAAKKNSADEAPAEVMLDQKDFPYVKYWSLESYTKARQEAKGNTTGCNTKRGIFGFLEDENGVRISKDIEQHLWKHTRGRLQDIDDSSVTVPKTWDREASQSLRLTTYCEIEAAYPFLRLCSHHWKAEKYVIQLYSRWRYNRRDFFEDTVKIEEKNGSCAEPTNQPDSEALRESEPAAVSTDAPDISATSTNLPSTKRKPECELDKVKKKRIKVNITLDDPL